jgi:hypothetical protein
MYKMDIGIDAGVIWRLLSEKGALSIPEIVEYTHFHVMFVYYSLGWLARENKIRFFEKGDSIYVELLINDYKETYF